MTLIFLALVLSLILIYFFPYNSLKALGFIPYIIYKRFFVIFVLRRRSRAIITHLGWIEYTLKGDSGPVLLYIHGSPGGYDQTIDPGENYRVLTPSRPGYLGTQIFAGRSPEEQAECFKALIDALNIDKVFVMGVSGGGPSSMHFAAKYPQNTSGLILFEAVSRSQDFREEDEELINSWDMDLFIQLSFISYDKEKLAARMLPNKNNRSRLLSKKKNIDELKKIIWSIWPISLRREGVFNDFKHFNSLNIPYESISVPTLIIHGDEDKNVSIEHAEYAKEKIEGSVLYTVSQGDHMMHATHSEEIETQIERFILEESKD